MNTKHAQDVGLCIEVRVQRSFWLISIIAALNHLFEKILDSYNYTNFINVTSNIYCEDWQYWSELIKQAVKKKSRVQLCSCSKYAILL